MAMSRKVLPWRGYNFDRPAGTRRNHVGDRAECGGLAARKVDEACGAVRDHLEDELNRVIDGEMDASVLAVAKQRAAAVLERPGTEPHRTVGVVRHIRAVPAGPAGAAIRFL